MNPLPTAANDGELETVKVLLVDGPATQADKDLALGRACCMGHFAIAELLFEHGADPNGQYETAAGKFEYGPILLASCEFLNPDGINWLLGHGADPNGNPTDSDYFQCFTPIEMVHETYSKNAQNRQTCIDLLVAAGARQSNGDSIT